jgi:hypothetical protein
MEQSQELQQLRGQLQECIAPYAGRVEYGNLRVQISEWDSKEGRITNVALVYETPGGSTDQINVSFHHQAAYFALVDEHKGEYTTTSIDEVMANVRQRVLSIPEKRLETLKAEVRRQIDGGSNIAGVFGHVNRALQSELRGGTITHLELKDAMTYAVHYMKEKGGAGGSRA